MLYGAEYGVDYKFNALDLTLYKELKFAVRSTGWYAVVYNGTVISETTDGGSWLVIRFVENGANWDLYYGEDFKASLSITNLSELNFKLGTELYSFTEMRGIEKHLHTWENIVSDETFKSHATQAQKALYYKTCSECHEISETETFEYGDFAPIFDITATPSSETAPEGFESAIAHTVSWNKYNFNSFDLTPYQIVKFAVKSSGWYGVMADGANVINETNGGGEWLEIKLVKNGENWDLYYGGEKQETLAISNLNNINFRFGDNTYHVTEIKAIDVNHPHDWVENINAAGAIKTPATQATKAVYYKTCSICEIHSEETFEYGFESIFAIDGIASTETAPEGFESAIAHTVSWNKYNFNSFDLTPYKVVKFAVKSSGWYGVMQGDSVVSAETNGGGEWLEIKLIKNGEKWDLYYGGVFQAELTLANNNLEDLNFRFGSNTYNVTELKCSTTLPDIELLKDSSTEYTIVFEQTTESIFAKDELVKYFNEATGITLACTGYAYPSTVISGKTIVIGLQPAELRGLSNIGIGDSDYITAVRGETVYIYGKTGHGVINGVYDFLAQLFDLEVYYKDTYTITRAEGDVIKTAAQLERVGTNTFNYILSGSGELRPENTSSDLSYAYQMGFVTDYYISMGNDHNALTLISYEEYGTLHPEWFYQGTTADGYNSGMQLVLACEDFSTANGSLVATVAEKLWTIIDENPNRKYFGFSPMDIDIWPTGTGYEKSDELYEKYGTHSAEYIMFMNAVAELIEDKIAASDTPNRVIGLNLLAYNKTLCAPDVTSLSQADKDAVMLYSGANVSVIPYIAPVESNYHMAFEDPRNLVKNPLTGKIDENSITVAKVIENWNALAGELHLWLYSLDAENYFMVLDMITNMQANYQFAKEHGVTVILDQNQYNTPVMTDWSRLKIYLRAELQRDVNVDIDAAIDNFMNAYFGAGAESMKALLTAQRSWYQTLLSKSYNEDTYNYTLGILRSSQWMVNKWQWTTECTMPQGFSWGNVLGWLSGGNKDNSKSTMITTWLGYTDAAKAAINADASLSDDEKAELCKRVDIESLTARYVLIAIFEETTYDASLDAFYQYAKSLGMTHSSEGTVIQ